MNKLKQVTLTVLGELIQKYYIIIGWDILPLTYSFKNILRGKIMLYH